MSLRSQSLFVIVAAALLFSHHPTLAIDVKAEADKTFDFKKVKTWGWNPKPGDLMMARSQSDNPAAAKAKAEPIIMDAVMKEMTQRGLQFATTSPDVVLTYYLLLSTNQSAQELGQFLPATTMWGVPPFAPATQSLQVMNAGSLVLDANVGQKIVWRGLAEAQLKTD